MRTELDRLTEMLAERGMDVRVPRVGGMATWDDGRTMWHATSVGGGSGVRLEPLQSMDADTALEVLGYDREDDVS